MIIGVSRTTHSLPALAASIVDQLGHSALGSDALALRRATELFQELPLIFVAEKSPQGLVNNLADRCRAPAGSSLGAPGQTGRNSDFCLITCAHAWQYIFLWFA